MTRTTVAALAVLALGFAIEMSAAGQAIGAAVAKLIATLSQPILGALGLDLLRDGVELRDPAAGWAVRVSEVCDGMGLVVALLAVIVVLAPREAPGDGWWIRALRRFAIGVIAIQVFNLLRVLVLSLAMGQEGTGFATFHDAVFPLASAVLIASLVTVPSRLALFAGASVLLWIGWSSVAGPVSSLLVPPVNAALAVAAPAVVGDIASVEGAWSVGTLLVAAIEPLQLYRTPIEPRHFTLALPVILAAAAITRRPGWLLMAIPLMALALWVAAQVAVFTLAAEKAPLTALVSAGDGTFLERDFAVPSAYYAILRVVQNTLVHALLLVMPALALAREAPDK